VARQITKATQTTSITSASLSACARKKTPKHARVASVQFRLPANRTLTRVEFVDRRREFDQEGLLRNVNHGA